MKMKFFFLGLILLSIAGFSQETCNLTISTTGSTNLKIRFAGKQYTLQDRSVTFQNLKPGTYELQIYQWLYKDDKDQYVEVYNYNTILTANKHMEVTVMRFGKTSWDEGTIQTDSWADATATPSHTSRNTGNQGADQTQFEKIKKAIDNEYSDDNKLSVAKAILKNNYIYTSQVKVIMNMFYDEDRKLAFAKYAYDYCVDTNNYFTLKEEFYSDTRKRSLMDFIGAR